MTNSANEPLPVGPETAINADDEEQESITSSWTAEELEELEELEEPEATEEPEPVVENDEGVRDHADLPEVED